MTDTRTVGLVVHPGRPGATARAAEVALALSSAGIETVVDACDDPIGSLASVGVAHTSLADATLELIIVFGGDGTLLRAAESGFARDIPLLGVNLGHVGFLAEADVDALPVVVDAVVQRSFTVEARMALSVSCTNSDGSAWQSWALNEVSVERAGSPRVIDLGLAVDGAHLSRYGADGMVCSTATGSTAYAFSAGGPVVWPDVQAICVVPVSAHGLFSRPLVVAPNSTVSVEMLSDGAAMLWADGRRGVQLGQGSIVSVSRSASDVLFARIHPAAFTGRLVGKFALPVSGWRAQGRHVD